MNVVRPAGVEHVICVRGEAHVQHTPAHIPGLHCSPQVEAPPGGVVQADVLVLAGREEHVAILAVHSAEGFLLVCVLVGYIVWQKMCADTSALSVGKTGASTSAVLPLKGKENITLVNIYGELN